MGECRFAIKKYFQNAVDKRARKAYTRVQKMSTQNAKYFFAKEVDKFGFGEKYIRDFEN